MYYNTEVIKNKRREPRSVYLTLKQKLKVIRETNESALFLLEFYMSKSGIQEYSYSDDIVAKTIEWTPRKVKDNRLKLEQAGLFRRETYGSGEKKAIITFIGESLVEEEEVTNGK